jgi:hypothetical protein
MQAVLEFQDGTCPWYYVLIPNSAWPTTAPSRASSSATRTTRRTSTRTASSFRRAPPKSTGSPTPARPTTPSRPPPSAWTGRCRPIPTSSTRRTQGPATRCGGSVTPPDPCSPLQPSGYHTVHFRYIWAGQKTFTFFPKPALMPKWIELEVNGTGSALKVICQREQDRPWFECPVPDSSFGARHHLARGGQVAQPGMEHRRAPWPLPATPKEYWIRWYYGKPDIPRTVDPPNFMVFDYYPDGTNGDWSATGVWNDSMCAPKPPATPVTVGFGNGAWFPYKKTQLQVSLRRIAGLHLSRLGDGAGSVQRLRVGALPDLEAELGQVDAIRLRHRHRARPQRSSRERSAKVRAMALAITAAIGDKDLFDKLWNFVRHYRSEKLLWAHGLDVARHGRLPAARTSSPPPAVTATAPSTATWTSPSVWSTRPCSGPSTPTPRPMAGQDGVRDQHQVRQERQLPKQGRQLGQELPERHLNCDYDQVPTVKSSWTITRPAISGCSATSWPPSRPPVRRQRTARATTTSGTRPPRRSTTWSRSATTRPASTPA